MRVIAGTLKGRRLEGADVGRACGPTSDKLRETLFNILAPRVAGARVLDVFAGTGAVGIEALSRGAASATCVEQDRRAVQLIEENSRALRRAKPLCYHPRQRGARARARPVRGGPFDIDRARPAVRLRRARRGARRGARRAARPPARVLVLEHAARVAPPAAGRASSVDTHRDSRRQRPVAFYRMSHRALATHRHLSRVVRPADQRARRHHRARRADLRHDHRRHPGQRREDAAVHGRGARRHDPRDVFRDEPNVEVDTFDGLLVDYAQRKSASVHRARAARRVGLRVRVPDGADEPPPGARRSRPCS